MDRPHVERQPTLPLSPNIALDIPPGPLRAGSLPGANQKPHGHGYYSAKRQLPPDLVSLSLVGGLAPRR